MKIFIPIRTTEILGERIKQSILAQTVQTDIQLIWNVPVAGSKRKSEHAARDKIKNLAKDEIDKYIIMQDSNIVHLYVNNFEDMISFLDANEKRGVVALYAGENGHVKPQCLMWRREVLSNVCNLSDNNKTCCCKRYFSSVNAQGFYFEYLDKIKRIKELL